MARINSVLFVLDMFGFFGGPERRAFRLAKGLKNAGLEISIVSIMKPEERMVKKAQRYGIKFYPLTQEGNKALKSFRVDVFFKLRKLINFINPDALFTFEFLADYTTKMATYGQNRNIYTFIGSTVWKWERKWHRKVFMEHFVKRSKLYIANSESVKRNVIRVLPQAKSKVAVLYNPIDTDEFRPFSKEEKESVRRKFGFKSDELLIGSVVRFYNPKGADVLIEAFAKSGLDAKLLLVGDGSQKEQLMELAKRLNISEKVIFMGALEATSEIYNLFDICVVPSQKGGFDNVVIEAMACGIPTVATKATGIGEIAKSGKDLVITEIDAVSISNGINSILKDLTQFSRNGRQFVLKKLAIEKITESLLELIDG